MISRRCILISSGIFILCTSSCIREFDPDITSGINLLAIDASLVKGRDIQKVIISRTVASDNNHIPYERNCTVFVEDEFGTKVYFQEASIGNYTAEIDDDYMVIGRNYRLNVITSDEETYQSDYEMLYDCPPVDSLYYIHEDKYIIKSDEFENGIQFYTDLRVNEGYSMYYRWLLEEDWVILSPYIRWGIWTGDSLIKDSVNLRTCYKHGVITELFSSSTENVGNFKKKIELNFISDNSSKIFQKYSLLIKQISLTPEAYAYWQQKKEELQESGSLYTRQPNQTTSNIINLNNDKEQVLGFFWVGKMTEQRAFVENGTYSYIDELSCEIDTIDSIGYKLTSQTCYMDEEFNIYCDTVPPEETELTPIEMPVYVPEYYKFYPLDSTRLYPYSLIGAYFMPTWYYTADPGCFDCRYIAGDTAPPDFWRE